MRTLIPFRGRLLVREGFVTPGLLLLRCPIRNWAFFANGIIYLVGPGAHCNDMAQAQGPEMNLFAFIHHVDPTKVKIEEREAREGEVPLLELTRGRVVSLAGADNQGHVNVQDAGNDNVNEEGDDALEAGQSEQDDHVIDIGGIDIVADDEIQAIVTDQPKKVRKKRKAADGASGSGLPPKKLREDHGTSGYVGASVAGKSLAALRGLLDSSTLAAEVGVTTAATVPFVTSSVTPTPEREGGGYMDSITGPNLRTQKPAERFVFSSDSPHEPNANAADDEVTSVVRSSVPDPAILTTAVATTVVADTSALVPRAGHGSGAGQARPNIFIDSVSPTIAEADVAGPFQPAMDYEQLLAEFNVGASRQACFNAEIRMWLEHELRGRQKLEERCAMQVNMLKEMDAEIASLKAQLSLKEVEAAEAIRLGGQIVNVEATEAARVNELNDLKERNVALEGQVAALEFAAASKDAELASSKSQVAKVTQDLSNLQLSCDELSVKASSLEFEKDKLIDQVSALETTCSGLRDEVMGYKLFKEQIEAVQDA
ncbi:hypothetical protein Tco_0091656 [Tanacetum coccineum]